MLFYRDEIINDYFYWLITIIADGREESYSKLLKQLFDTPFIASHERDANRAHDGVDLRDRYCYEMNIDLDMVNPCSVLEMMVALAIRCEMDVMYDPTLGDRTYIWFWLMIENLGLLSMTDSSINHQYVETVLMDFMQRNYSPDGKGNIFYVPGCNDIREKEIWYQMNTFLDSLMG